MQEWEGLRALLRAPESDGSENMCKSQQTTGKSKGDDFMNSYLCYSFTIKKDCETYFLVIHSRAVTTTTYFNFCVVILWLNWSSNTTKTGLISRELLISHFLLSCPVCHHGL